MYIRKRNSRITIVTEFIETQMVVMVLPIQDGSATVKVELRIYVNKVMG